MTKSRLSVSDAYTLAVLRFVTTTVVYKSVNNKMRVCMYTQR